MRRVLFNFVTANTGGVIEFKKSIVRSLNAVAPEYLCEIYVIYSSDDFDEMSTLDGVNFICFPYIPKSISQKIKFYEFDLNQVLKEYGIDFLINFGDIPARTKVFQTFYFDWPYAVYNDLSLWRRMKFGDFVSKALKRSYFFLTRQRPNKFIAQTQTMKSRLSRYVPESKIVVIDVGFNLSEAMLKSGEDTLTGIPQFIYPTAVYPHKNINILIDAAMSLRRLCVKCIFVLTFDGSEGRVESNFVKRVRELGLQSYFEFCGRLSRDNLTCRIRLADSIIMPTLIETYGLPYLEAQVFRKAMLTSDRDFSRELCGDAALYFDPLDPEDVARVVKVFIEEPLLKERLENASGRRLEDRIDWNECVRRILNQSVNFRR